MEYSDIVKLLSNPDTVAEGLTNLETYNKDMTGELETLKQTKAENEKSIADLRDSNMRLYLRVTGKPEEKEDEKDDYTILTDAITGGKH